MNLHTPHEAMQALAHFVKNTRLNLEMTADELSSRAGVSRTTLARMEKDGSGSIDTLVKALSVLGVIDTFVDALKLPERVLTIADLEKLSKAKQRKRGKRRKPNAA